MRHFILLLALTLGAVASAQATEADNFGYVQDVPAYRDTQYHSPVLRQRFDSASPSHGHTRFRHVRKPRTHKVTRTPKTHHKKHAHRRQAKTHRRHKGDSEA